MKRYSQYRKGQISLFLPVYIMATMFVLTSIYKFTSANIAKENLYPYKEYYKKHFCENDYGLLNGFILKIDKNTIYRKEDIKNYLIGHFIEMIDGENKVYFDSNEDKIIYIKKFETFKIKYRFDYEYSEGEIVVHRTSYYEGVI